MKAVPGHGVKSSMFGGMRSESEKFLYPFRRSFHSWTDLPCIAYHINMRCTPAPATALASERGDCQTRVSWVNERLLDAHGLPAHGENPNALPKHAFLPPPSSSTAYYFFLDSRIPQQNEHYTLPGSAILQGRTQLWNYPECIPLTASLSQSV